MSSQHRLGLFVVLLTLMLVGGVHSQEPSEPIPNPSQAEDQQLYFGSPAEAQPIVSRPIPVHPFMLGDESSNVHNDAYMSDTYTHPGPLGINPQVSSVNLGAICVTMTFDSQGRLATACLNLKTATLFLLKADTLEILDSLELPYREVSLADLDFPPGSYFYSDAEASIYLPVINSQIWKIAITSDNTFETETVFDLSQSIPSGDEVKSILPAFDGRLWFTTGGGMVGTLDAETQVTEILPLENERIANSLAMDETGGVFVVTDTAMYRFDADEAGKPTITWREEYDRGTEVKPGQVSQGSGTTPTLMGEKYVAITDNAEPQMNVLVYQRAPEIEGERLVCAVPVFTEGRSATENSLIATDSTIIVENNYDYVPLQFAVGKLSEPGITRIDVAEDGTCEVIWTSEERVPNAVSKLSLATGLIYTYTREAGDMNTGAWLLTVIDFATGETAWEQYIGTGSNFNSNYASVYLGQDGTAYVGVTSGIVVVRDAP